MKKKKKKSNKKKVVKKAKKLTTSKICCVECGVCKGMSKDRRLKLIATFGSEEELHAKYICRTCRTKLNVRKDGKLKPVKKKRIPKATSLFKRDADGEVILPDWMINMTFHSERKRASNEDLAKTGTCWHPTEWINNGRVCDGCPSIDRGSCGATKNFTKVKKLKKIKKVKKTKKTKKTKGKK